MRLPPSRPGLETQMRFKPWVFSLITRWQGRRQVRLDKRLIGLRHILSQVLGMFFPFSALLIKNLLLYDCGSGTMTTATTVNGYTNTRTYPMNGHHHPLDALNDHWNNSSSSRRGSSISSPRHFLFIYYYTDDYMLASYVHGTTTTRSYLKRPIVSEVAK